MRASPKPLSQNNHLIRWVEKMADLCTPQAIHWVDGSEEKNTQLCAQLVESGTLIKLNEDLWPGEMMNKGQINYTTERTIGR